MKVKESLTRAVQLYFSSALLYGVGILLFRNVSYYQNVLLLVTQRTLLYIYLTYLVVAPIIYIFRTTKYTTNKPYLILRYLINVFRKNKFKPNKEERVALLFILVKVFYLPLMINFFFNNFRNVPGGGKVSLGRFRAGIFFASGVGDDPPEPASSPISGGSLSESGFAFHLGKKMS